MKNLLQQTKQSLLLVTLLLTSTTLPLTTAFAADTGNVNNTSAGSSSALVAPGTNDSQGSNNNTASNIALVTVGDPGNAPDAEGSGAVDKIYQIGKYEVTAAQYCAFLNAVAWKEDPHGLYNPQLGTDKAVASIIRTEYQPLFSLDYKTFGYQVIPGREDLPVTYVTLNNAKRFCNWVENGRPTYPQEYNLIDQATTWLANLALQSGATNTLLSQEDPLLFEQLKQDKAYDLLQVSTEVGSYTFGTDANGNEVVEANPNGHYHIPTDNEWVKAGYYKGNGVNAAYSLYPTQYDVRPWDDNFGALYKSKTVVLDSRGRVANNEANVFLSSTPDVFMGLHGGLKLTPVDYYNDTTSFYGARDMAGNVAEWTDTLDPSGFAVARGGSWQTTYGYTPDKKLDETREGFPKSYNPSVGADFIGFRTAFYVDGAPTDPNDPVVATSVNQVLAQGGARQQWMGLFLGAALLSGEITVGFIGTELVVNGVTWSLTSLPAGFEGLTVWAPLKASVTPMRVYMNVANTAVQAYGFADQEMSQQQQNNN